MKKNRLLIYLLVISIFVLSGCSVKKPHFLQKEEDPVSTLTQEAVLTNGQEIYNATLELIQSAQETIYIEQSTFDHPTIKQALIEKARSGIEIKILVDQFQKANKTTMDELKSENISIQYYPAQKGQHHRVRLMVVDYSRALIYGPSWTESDLNSPNLAVKLTEKSAWKTAYNVFLKDWKHATTLTLDVPKSTTLPDDYITLALNANIKQQILQQINKAQSKISIELTDLTSEEVVSALIEASKKGIQVQVLLGPQADSSAQTAIVENLRENNIEVRYYPRKTLRQFAVFDDRSFLMSSSGWTYNTFVINHELSITVPSPQASQKLLELFQNDWNISKEEVISSTEEQQ